MSTLLSQTMMAKIRITLTYAWRHRRQVQIGKPQRFTDWIQWRKLNDRDPRMPLLADKLYVKQHVAQQLGEEWVTPTLFHGRQLPETPPCNPPYVVKARHGCNQNIFVRQSGEDWHAIRAAAHRWMRRPYGTLLDEWLYQAIPPGILVEPFIGVDGSLPIDYKIFVFGGRAECIKVDLDRENGHWRAHYRPDWTPLWAPSGWPGHKRPASLDQMIAAAEKLGKGFTFVRVDFYEIAGKPRFGEMTFYPGSGLSPLDDDLDHWLGEKWSRATNKQLDVTAVA